MAEEQKLPERPKEEAPEAAEGSEGGEKLSKKALKKLEKAGDFVAPFPRNNRFFGHQQIFVYHVSCLIWKIDEQEVSIKQAREISKLLTSTLETTWEKIARNQLFFIFSLFFCQCQIHASHYEKPTSAVENCRTQVIFCMMYLTMGLSGNALHIDNIRISFRCQYAMKDNCLKHLDLVTNDQRSPWCEVEIQR